MLLAQPGDWPATIAPALADLPEPLAHRWHAVLPDASARLAPHGDRLLLLDRHGAAADVGAEPPIERWPRAQRLPPGGPRPAFASAPVYVTDGGRLGRWSTGSPFAPLWSTGVPGARLDALGLPGGRVLVSSSAWPDSLRLYDEERDAVRWTLALVVPRALPAGDACLGVVGDDLVAIDLLRGEIRWRRPGIAALRAVAGETVAALDAAGDLVLLALRDGSDLGRVALGFAGARSLLDPDGRLHVAGGGTLQVVVVDLAGGGAVVARDSYPLPGSAAAPLVRTADGRLLIVAGGGLVEVRDAEAVELWRGDGVIAEAQPHSGQLFVLERSPGGPARLHCLGPRG